MSFPENWIFFFKQKKGVGGNQNPPPAPCLRPAYPAACVPAYAERTGQPESSVKRWMGLTGRGLQNGAFLRWEPAT
jgi:hypothetical protein